jgi:small subunit ribosomal protein S1
MISDDQSMESTTRHGETQSETMIPPQEPPNEPSSNFEDVSDEYLEPGEAPASAEMDALMDQYLDQMSADVNQGQTMTVTVVAVKEDGVLVDLGEKSEGFVPLREFPVVDDKPRVAPGDQIEVVVKGHDHASGLINLSYREALRRRAWKEAEDAFNSKTPLKGVVTRTVKGGLILDIGTTAFLPASQIDLHRVNDFDAWIGREVEGFVIEFAPAKRRIILSRRQLLENRREAERRERFGALSVGQEIQVTVKRIVDFGAFVDLGGVDGLIPRSEISWQRNAKPDDFLAVDQQIAVKVIEIDLEANKVTLSRRQLQNNPWDTAVESYPADSEVSGKVVSLTNYGAFVRLEEGLDGMVHISDMGWDSAGKRPSDYVQPGAEVTAQVLSVDPKGRRISLGLKQLTTDPWGDIEERFPKGKRIEGPVTGLTKYGAFVELEPGIEGMIHVSDFAWDKRVSQPRDMVKKGDRIEACILDIDRERRRISLGVKQLSESPFERFSKDFNVGDIVEGEVVNATDFGVFMKLPSGVEGFIHVSQLDHQRIDRPADRFKPGEKMIAKVTKIEADSGKISLSRKQLLKEREKKQVQTYKYRNERGSLNNMGELLGDIRLEDDLIVDTPRKPTAPAPVEVPVAKTPVTEAPVSEATAAPAEIDPKSLADGPPPSSPETPSTPPKFETPLAAAADVAPALDETPSAPASPATASESVESEPSADPDTREKPPLLD